MYIWPKMPSKHTWSPHHCSFLVCKNVIHAELDPGFRRQDPVKAEEREGAENMVRTLVEHSRNGYVS